MTVLVCLGILYVLSMARFEHCTVTAYCQTPRRTSWPADARKGTAAVDPRVIPYGSRIYIGGRWWTAMGRHGGSGRVVDLWMTSRHKCLDWGRRKRLVIVVHPRTAERRRH